MHMCAPDTHADTVDPAKARLGAYSLFYNQIPTSTSSWASSNHKADASDG